MKFRTRIGGLSIYDKKENSAQMAKRIKQSLIPGTHPISSHIFHPCFFQCTVEVNNTSATVLKISDQIFLKKLFPRLANLGFN